MSRRSCRGSLPRALDRRRQRRSGAADVSGATRSRARRHVDRAHSARSTPGSSPTRGSRATILPVGDGLLVARLRAVTAGRRRPQAPRGRRSACASVSSRSSASCAGPREIALDTRPVADDVRCRSGRSWTTRGRRSWHAFRPSRPGGPASGSRSTGTTPNRRRVCPTATSWPASRRSAAARSRHRRDRPRMHRDSARHHSAPKSWSS